MWGHIKNIYFLGIKEFIELSRDYLMLVLILFAFTANILMTAKASPDAVQRGAIAVVDQDKSQLSQRIIDSFLPPTFLKPVEISMQDMDRHMDMGDYVYILVIPDRFQRDVLEGNHPEVELAVDATCMTQAFVGSGYIEQIVNTEIQQFVTRQKAKSITSNGTSQEEAASNNASNPARIVIRNRYNMNLTASWFGGVNQLANITTMLAFILIGAALIRERERGTLEHLLVMPVVPFEIMCAKIWSMLIVVLIATVVSVLMVLHCMLEMPLHGSVALFAVGVAMHLFAVTSFGIFLACVAQNMPQLGILVLLVLMPMNMLSGGITPLDCMPKWIQIIMQFAPTTHFIRFSQQILFRGAGIEVVWRPFIALFIIGCVLFFYSLGKFRKSAT